MKREIKNPIELRSEKVRNIIGKVPPVLLRYGIMIIGVALLVLVGISAFIPYQPTFDTQITANQDALGKLHFSAEISQQAMDKQLQFAYIEMSSASEFPLPKRYSIQSVSDTAQISNRNVYYQSSLQPIDPPKLVTVEDTVSFPAKILLKKRSVLMWIMRFME